jgi:hypothetical protein
MPLTYLLKIAHGRFPLEVTHAPDIRHVSILKATGLVEARISSAVGGGGIYRKAEIAVVFGLTDEGRRELFAMRSRLPATLPGSSQRARERRAQAQAQA